MKFVIFGYEILIQKYYTLHITDQQSQYENIEKYVLKYPVKKRINAMISSDGFIVYIFRGFDMALLKCNEFEEQLEYDKLREQLLREVILKLTNIRNILLKKAKQNQIELYDNKIHKCFNNLCNIIKNRKDYETLDYLKTFDIKEYYNIFNCDKNKNK